MKIQYDRFLRIVLIYKTWVLKIASIIPRHTTTMAETINFDEPMDPPVGVYLVVYLRNNNPQTNKDIAVTTLDNKFYCRGQCCPAELWEAYHTFSNVKRQYNLQYDCNVMEWGLETGNASDTRSNSVRPYHALLVGPLHNTQPEKACLAAADLHLELSAEQKQVHQRG